MANHGGIFSRGKGESLAGLFGPTRASDAVGIGVSGVREVEVDYVGNLRNVDTVSGNVSGHHDVELAVAEPVHSLVSGILRHVAL